VVIGHSGAVAAATPIGSMISTATRARPNEERGSSAREILPNTGSSASNSRK
jgi:hypothetical protein